MYRTPWTPMDAGRKDDNAEPTIQEAMVPKKLCCGRHTFKSSTMMDTLPARPKNTFVCSLTSLPRASGMAVVEYKLN